jgi:hypothetical protein
MSLALGAFLILLLLPMGLTFWAIYHVLAVADFGERPLMRFAWLALVVLVPVVGALIYLATGRPKGPQAPRAPLPQ